MIFGCFLNDLDNYSWILEDFWDEDDPEMIHFCSPKSKMIILDDLGYEENWILEKCWI